MALLCPNGGEAAVHVTLVGVKRLLLLLLASGCAAAPAAVTRTGILQPGGTVLVRSIAGDINAYAPARGEPADRFTISAYTGSPAGVAFSVQRLVVHASARVPGVRFLVRAPRGTALDLETQTGNIGVADYDGVVNAHAGSGDIKMLIPSFGSASTGHGNISVIFASDSWPGTLRFASDDGNVEVYVNEHARARVRMHTDDGTVFSDFNLTGTSSGTAETIDAPINGGGPRSIDIEVKRGSIRVMQLKPQV